MKNIEKVAIIFPGQGAQYIGMGKSLYNRYSIAKELYDAANDVLGYDIKKICFDGSLLELNKIKNSLVSIFINSIIFFRIYQQEIGINPVITAGHSLGEITALVCSGVMSYADGLKVINKRSEITESFQEKKGIMSVIDNATRDIIERYCKQYTNNGNYAAISCFNSNSQFSISGDTHSVMNINKELIREGFQVTPLLNSFPFHCELLKKASKKLENALNKYTFYKFKWEVLANQNAKPYESVEDIKTNLSLQLIKPVLWSEIMNSFYQRGIDCIIDIGPQNILKSMVNEIPQGIKIISYSCEQDKKKLYKMLSVDEPVHSKDIKGNYNSIVTKCLKMGISTKNHNIDETKYEENVIIPYQEIVRIQDKLDEFNLLPGLQDMISAIEALYTIFNGKKIPIPEQKRRFKRIFNETNTTHLFRDFYKLKYKEELNGN